MSKELPWTHERRRADRVKSSADKLGKYKPNARGYFDSAAALENLLSSRWGRK